MCTQTVSSKQYSELKTYCLEEEAENKWLNIAADVKVIAETEWDFAQTRLEICCFNEGQTVFSGTFSKSG